MYAPLKFTLLSLLLGSVTAQTKTQETITCGGLLGLPCPAEQFCYIEQSNVADATGVCLPRPTRSASQSVAVTREAIPAEPPATLANAEGTETPTSTAPEAEQPGYIFVGEGEACLTFVAGPLRLCESGLGCDINPDIPDAGGVCVDMRRPSVNGQPSLKKRARRTGLASDPLL
ncbi:hypothetical protein DFS34DRAFT_694511 [Phlyctochytrium arcticum]|nr:hypothetical protein DFS34DRAFT_694511 [Phlyctochytrium arcticum]